MYVKIIDKGECFSTTMEYIDGVYANKIEWEKHNFYPKNGMVGEVVKRTPSAFIVKIKEGIYVPMTRNGIQEISFEEFQEGQSNNVCTGMDERQRRINEGVDKINRQTGYDWTKLPNWRNEFKQDIIQNIIELTCDYKRNIFLGDLVMSAVIYAADMCLEYRYKSGRDLAPMIVEDMTNQVCDVYMELFPGQFCQPHKNSCIERVSAMVIVDPQSARDTIDNYYQRVKERYSYY